MVIEYRPTTPSRRHMVRLSRKDLTKRSANNPFKPLLLSKKRSGGRNNLGRITSRHRGGGHKRHYRIIDFKRTKDGIPAKVLSVEYDPNRSSHIALLSYLDGEKRYIIAPTGIKQGDSLFSGESAPIKKGNSLPLSKLPLGSTIHNVELYPGRGGKLARTAGTHIQLMGRNGGYATLKLPSGEVRVVRESCRATLGSVSNSENNLRVWGKAGSSCWMGKRPLSRGTARNPVDHPHGGGEGKQNSYIPRSFSGVKAKGFKTRSKKRSDKFIVKDRRKK